MTSTNDRRRVAVTVHDVWDTVRLEADGDWTVDRLKREALGTAVGSHTDPGEYVVKYKGALIRDEEATLDSLAVPDGAAMIVIRGHRRPSR